MPIPRPKPGERRPAFMNRCIPILIETEGEEANVAGGICGTAWENKNKTEEGKVPDHERDLSAELQALANLIESEGVDPLDTEAGFTGVADAMASTDLADLEAELRAVEVPEHMRHPSLMGTEEDLLQEP